MKGSKALFGIQNVLVVIVDLSVQLVLWAHINMIILMVFAQHAKISLKHHSTLKKVFRLLFVLINVLLTVILTKLILNALMSLEYKLKGLVVLFLSF